MQEAYGKEESRRVFRDQGSKGECSGKSGYSTAEICFAWSKGPQRTICVQAQDDAAEIAAATGGLMPLLRSLVICMLACCVPAFAQISQTLGVGRENRTITVTATDTASAVADQAIVHVGYQAFGEDEASTYAEGSRRSNAVMEALRAFGVQAEAIESEDQSLQPLNEYELKNLAPAIKNMRYRITQAWTVRTNPELAAKTLDVAVRAGANQSGNIGWEMKDGSSLEATASAKALAHAQVIAGRMAEGLHIRIGPLLYASNQSQETVVRPLMAMAAPMNSRMRKDAAPLSISGRRVERSATVFAIFAIEQRGVWPCEPLPSSMSELVRQ